MKTKSKYYSIVYDGVDSYIMSVSGPFHNKPEGAMSYTKAKKELMEFFSDQIKGYKATLSYYHKARAKLKDKCIEGGRVYDDANTRTKTY